MFRHLPPFNPRDTEVDNLNYFEAVADTMIDHPGIDQHGDNKAIPAGYTYFGQFVDHDITFDPTSALQRQNDPDSLNNFRTPCFDLDSLYGNGPNASPYLYEPNGVYLITGLAENGEVSGEADLQRNPFQTAIIGDPRNDENVLISQLQLVFIKFHNAVVDALIDAQGFKAQAQVNAGDIETVARQLNRIIAIHQQEIFETAQLIVRWHYQWVVINDFLKKITMPTVYDELIPNPGQPDESRLKWYHYRYKPFIPVEFSVAAYRFGHSMVRTAYTLNDVTPQTDPAAIPLFNATEPQASLGHLGGSRQLPAVWSLNWEFFLDIGDKAKTQFSRLINTRLVDPLALLPPTVVGKDPKALTSLALRNLVRSWRMQLPSGQAVARAIGVPTASILRQDDFDGYGQTDLPLWYYILKEAREMTRGKSLGLVGSRIVAEVFIGLLTGDPLSYVNQNPLWTPQTSTEIIKIPAQGNNFELSDIIRFSGLPTNEQSIHAINQAGQQLPVRCT